MKKVFLFLDKLITIINIILFFVLIYIICYKGISLELILAFVVNIIMIILGIKNILNKGKDF